MKTNALLLAVIVVASKLHAQGTFQNLDFESPILPLVPAPNGFISIANNLLPGWNGYINGDPFDGGYFNNLALSVASVSLHNSLSPVYQPIQGSYSVYLSSSSVSKAAIGQTGQIPQDAFTLLFQCSANPDFQVTFGGQPIPLVQFGTSGNNIIMAGDISMFAGQTGELRFTGGGLFDDIQFSSQAVPEPGVLGLSAIGGLLLGWRLRRKA